MLNNWKLITASTDALKLMEKSLSTSNATSDKVLYVPPAAARKNYGFRESRQINVSRHPVRHFGSVDSQDSLHQLEQNHHSSQSSFFNRATTSGGSGQFFPSGRNPRAEAVLFPKDGQGKGINFDSYDNIPVNVDGVDVPEHMTSFSSLDFGDLINDNIRLCGFEKPTPIQKYGIPSLIAKRDLMACAQTGSGKTAAFLLPIVGRLFKERLVMSQKQEQREPDALILAPTRELAQQILLDARRLTYRSMLRAVCVYGGSDVRRQIDMVCRGCDILVATPGRLIDIITQNVISLSSCKYLVLDEADRMLDMGFEPQIRRMLSVSRIPGVGDRQTAMFSATFPQKIQELARDFLLNEIFVTVGRVGSASENITQVVSYVSENDKLGVLIKTVRELKDAEPSSRILIFAERKCHVNFLEEKLHDNGHKVVSIHGDRSQADRDMALALFRQNKATVMVATDVAQRGLDIPNVSHVINYAFPNDIENYVHRIGRTGRAGNVGTAITFFNETYSAHCRDLVCILTENKQVVPQFLREMESADNRRSYGRSYGNSYRNNWNSSSSSNSNGRLDSNRRQGNYGHFERKSQRDYWGDDF